MDYKEKQRLRSQLRASARERDRLREAARGVTRRELVERAVKTAAEKHLGVNSRG